MDALIGWSGFVGSCLRRQHKFDSLYRSFDIHEIRGRWFDTIVCAGAPGVKWLANANPDADRSSVLSLQSHLRFVRANNFVLISTIDVFPVPKGVDERSLVHTSGETAYGRHRRELEMFVAGQFGKHLIVRLPGIVGPGLKKNPVFDLKAGNNLDRLDCRAIYQFYPMVNLWNDIVQVLQADLSLVHLTAEPISLSELAAAAFGTVLENIRDDVVPEYDVRTIYAKRLGGGDLPYNYTKRESLLAIRAYAQGDDTFDSLGCP